MNSSLNVKKSNVNSSFATTEQVDFHKLNDEATTVAIDTDSLLCELRNIITQSPQSNLAMNKDCYVNVTNDNMLALMKWAIKASNPAIDAQVEQLGQGYSTLLAGIRSENKNWYFFEILKIAIKAYDPSLTYFVDFYEKHGTPDDMAMREARRMLKVESTLTLKPDTVTHAKKSFFDLTITLSKKGQIEAFANMVLNTVNQQITLIPNQIKDTQTLTKHEQKSLTNFFAERSNYVKDFQPILSDNVSKILKNAIKYQCGNCLELALMAAVLLQGMSKECCGEELICQVMKQGAKDHVWVYIPKYDLVVDPWGCTKTYSSEDYSQLYFKQYHPATTDDKTLESTKERLLIDDFDSSFEATLDEFQHHYSFNSRADIKKYMAIINRNYYTSPAYTIKSQLGLIQPNEGKLCSTIACNIF